MVADFGTRGGGRSRGVSRNICVDHAAILKPAQRRCVLSGSSRSGVGMKFGMMAASLAFVIATTGCQEHKPGAISSGQNQPAGAAAQQREPGMKQAEVLDQLPPVAATAGIDRSGRKEVGKASYYARHFDGRTMADGNRFKPSADIAASRICRSGPLRGTELLQASLRL